MNRRNCAISFLYNLYKFLFVQLTVLALYYIFFLVHEHFSVIYYNLLTNKHFIFVKLKFKSINRITLFSSLVKFSVEKKFWLNNQWPIC